MPVSPSPLPVLIIGTGPSGLLLAHALKKAHIPFQLFERDSALNVRAQGYRFRITGEGVLALQENLTTEHFALLKRSCGANLNNPSVTNLDSVTAIPVPGGPPPRRMDGPEPLCADRKVFRSMLARGLEPDIAFDHELTHYTLSSSGDSVTAHFAQGVSATGSLLVAADGAWSRIRRQYLPDFIPLDTEARWLYGKTPLTPSFREAFNPAALRAMTLVSDRRAAVPVTLLLEPILFDRSLPPANDGGVDLPADYIYWVLGSRADHLDTSSLGSKPSAEACAALARELVQGWHPSFQALFATQDESQTSILRIGTMMPTLPVWKASRVTMVGDAVHCMSPTAGIGASTSLRDAAFLGKTLAENWETMIRTEEREKAEEAGVVKSVERYETAMREWAAEAIEMSAMGGRKMFGMRPFEELKPFGDERRDE